MAPCDTFEVWVWNESNLFRRRKVNLKTSQVVYVFAYDFITDDDYGIYQTCFVIANCKKCFFGFFCSP
jgi:hypothetical protein